MAKQRGVFKAQGLLDEFSFYESADGLLVRKKGGVTRERMATDPAFERTREHQKEFVTAHKGGKILRTSLRSILLYAKDRRLSARILTRMLKVVKSDPVNQRGARTVVDGNIGLMEGFEFNPLGSFTETFGVKPVITIDRSSGKLEIDIPAFVPTTMIKWPFEATHFKIVAAGGSVDFATGISNFSFASTEDTIIGKEATTASKLSFTVESATPLPLFLVLGISFSQLVNGYQDPLKTRDYNAMQIVKVSVA